MAEKVVVYNVAFAIINKAASTMICSSNTHGKFEAAIICKDQSAKLMAT